MISVEEAIRERHSVRQYEDRQSGMVQEGC